MSRLIFICLLLGIVSCSPKISGVKNSLTESESYNIEPIRAVRANNVLENNLSVVFLITPKNEDSFPPIVSMRLGYVIGEKEQYVNLGKQTGDGTIQVVLYDQNVKDKDPKIYSIVKDKIQMEEYNDMLLLIFEFNNKVEMNAKEIGIIYGLWEKNNRNVRVEKRYDFKIENIDL